MVIYADSATAAVSFALVSASAAEGIAERL